MVVLARVVVGAFLTVAGEWADDVFARVGIECRDPLLREFEVVAAVEITFLRFRIGNKDAVGFLEDRGGEIVEGGVAVADDLDVAGDALGLGAVDVDIGESLFERVKGMGRVVAGTEEAFFFGGDGEEKEAALRTSGGGERGETLGDFEEYGRADGIVGGTVEDLVAGELSIAAEVIPVGGVDDVVVAQQGVCAVEFRDDVFRGDFAGGVGDGEGGVGGERDGFEITFRGGGFQGRVRGGRRPR